ncbi:hypothetical protein BGZ98_004016, partial [Dissophora globulifera]
MKNLFSVLLIATLAVGLSVSAQAVPDVVPQAVPDAVPQADVEASMPQAALCNNCNHDHEVHHENHFSLRCDNGCLIECLFDVRECRDICRHEVKECSGICRERRGKCGLVCQGLADTCNKGCDGPIEICESVLMTFLFENSDLFTTTVPISITPGGGANTGPPIVISDGFANGICSATDCFGTCVSQVTTLETQLGFLLTGTLGNGPQ